MSIMIRTVIRPQKRHIQLDIPKEYIGKEIEITYIPLDEVNQASDNKPVKKMKDFWGSISDDTATKLHKHISQSRAEWKRDI
jgi:hypothetical protein